VINHSNIYNCFCDSSSLKTLLATDNLGNIKTIIAFDEVQEEDRVKASQKNIKIIAWSELKDLG